MLLIYIDVFMVDVNGEGEEREADFEMMMVIIIILIERMMVPKVRDRRMLLANLTLILN